MSNVWGYRDEFSSDLKTSGRDFTGYDVEAIDGHIGKIDETSSDSTGACIVVDTGFWIFGKKRLIPAGVVSRIDPVENKVFVNMTKEQIKNAPDYRDDWKAADDYRSTYSDYYEPHSW